MYHLDQGHLGHRVEKVHPHQPLGPCELRSEFFEDDAGSVRPQHRVAFQLRLHCRVQLTFCIRIFVNGFDDHIGVRNTFSSHIATQMIQSAAPFEIVAISLGKVFPGTLQGPLHQLLGAILKRHIQVTRGAQGGDVTAHEPRAHDMDAFDFEGRVGAEIFQPVLQ